MNNIIGEIEIVKTALDTGAVSNSFINNTTTGFMFKRAITDIDSTIMYSPKVLITDADFYFGKLIPMTTSIPTYLQTFNILGSDISGEYWPQLYRDDENNRFVITVKNRFNAPTATRHIKMIYMASNNTEVLAGVNLPTPCEQTPNDLLDIYYRIYVNYGNIPVTDPNYNQNMMRATGIINKFFIYNNTSYGAYVPGTNTYATSNQGYRIMEAALPYSPDLRYIPNAYGGGYTTDAINRTASSAKNINEGSTKIKYTMQPNDAIGQLVKTVGSSMVSDSGSSWSNASRIVSINRVVPDNTSLMQSVYLRTASSKTSNIPYLDASSIGTSTAKPVFDTSAYNGNKDIPEAFRIVITKGGTPGTATFNLETRSTLGFIDNQFNKEATWSFRSIFKSYPYPDKPVYEEFGPIGDGSINFSGYGHLVTSSDEQHILSYATDGVTKINAWSQDFSSWGAKNKVPHPFTNIYDISEGSDGAIYVADATNGLYKIDTTTNAVTKFTGITGVDENKCYTVAAKDNGDVWAIFEGGLAKFTKSTSSWEVFNTTSTRKITNTLIVNRWNACRGIVLRKDGSADKLCLIAGDRTVVWYTPDGDPNGINLANVTYAYTLTNGKTVSKNRVINMSGTDNWAFVSTDRIRFCKFGETVTTASSITINAGSSSVNQRIGLASKFIDNAYRFVCVDGVAGSSTTRTAIFNADGSDYYIGPITDNPLPSGYCNQILDSNLNVFSNTDAYDSKAYSGPSLRNAVGGGVSQSWTKWGWDSANSKWVKGSTASCPVSTGTPISLPNGTTVKWNADNVASAFIVGEFWLGYIYDGIHKDNSTSTTFGYIRNSRDSYRTKDLSSNTITASGSSRTIALSFDTLYSDMDTRILSWGGTTATGAYSRYTEMTNQPSVDTLPYSEYRPTGNFKIVFKANPGSRISGDSYNGNARMGITRNRQTTGWDVGFGYRSGKYYVYDKLNRPVNDTAYSKDSVFTIERVGTSVTLAVDGTVVYTVGDYGSQKTDIICGFYNEDVMFFRETKLTYIESRPYVTIGNVTNSTGIYDKNFAMVESWASNPSTAKITINGTQAKILTDPLVDPASGEVLLLQKSGTLIFNTANIGASVTADTVILQEL